MSLSAATLCFTAFFGCLPTPVTSRVKSDHWVVRGEYLIDQLTTTPWPANTLDALKSLDQFFGVKTTDLFLNEGDTNTQPPEPLVELAKLGFDAIPALIHHIDDPRATQLTLVKDSNLWAIEFGGQYERRNLGRRPKYVPTTGFEDAPKGQMSSYTFRVGDLCYIVLGKIVNRKYQWHDASLGGGGVHIQSPVASAKLAASVRSDWSGITRRQLLDSLKEDLFVNELYSMSYFGARAIKSMWLTDRKEAERWAVKYVSRPVIFLDDPSELWRVADANPSTWRTGLQQYVSHSGKGSQKMAPWLIAAWQQEGDRPEDQPKLSAFRSKMFPQFLLPANRLPPCVKFNSLSDFVREGNGLESVALDHAIDEAFKKALQQHNLEADWVFDTFAIQCALRLAPKGYVEPYKSYLRLVRKHHDQAVLEVREERIKALDKCFRLFDMTKARTAKAAAAHPR